MCGLDLGGGNLGNDLLVDEVLVDVGDDTCQNIINHVLCNNHT